MRIAHFAIFSPHASGQYATVKDLILAERSLGIDAQFIDCGTDDKHTVRSGLVDGEIKTQPLDWVDNADIVIRHTSVPKSVFLKKPVVLALHGRPESSFLIEKNGKSPVLSGIRKEIKQNRYKGYFTFWEEHIYYWKHIHGIDATYVPAPVNFEEFDITGEKHDFGNYKAGLNLVIADIWRDDYTPFNLLFAAEYFKKRYHPDTRLHIYGMPTKETCFGFVGGMQKNGVIGEVGGVISWIDRVYRGADILLTPNIIATRIIREAMASGLPFVAPHGCQYTPFLAEPRDYRSFARAINACYLSTTIKTRHVIRQRARKLFEPMDSAKAVKELCEKILGGAPAEIKQDPQSKLWNAMSINQDDWEVLKLFIDRNNIKDVVEFGSGTSTILMDELGLKVTSYDKNEKWSNKINEKLKNSQSFHQKTKNVIIMSDYDMAFIDGPHGGKNREPSYKSVFESKIPIVACHDMMRKEDRHWVKKYFSDWQPLLGTNDLLIMKRPNIC